MRGWSRGLTIAATCALLAPGTARAGSGPWVLGAGASSLFLGIESQRLTMLSIQTAPDTTDEIEVGEGLSTLGVKGIVSYGLLPRIEASVQVPWFRVQANRQDEEVCAALGLGACRTTQGVGIIEARAKALLVDELRGSPLSVSVGVLARYGAFTAPTRQRITNIGEGTFDLGPTLAIGRIGGLGRWSGYWSAWADLGWRYRFGNTDDFPSIDGPVPGSEYTGDVELLVSPGDGRIGFGPAVTGFWRPNGVDWYELERDGTLTDVDRFSALRVYNIRVGGEILVRGRAGTTLSVSGQRVVVALNNPTDVLVFTIGLSFNRTPDT
ncbi:MAG: hypothetical protein AAFV53_05940 [Myxococcota bacterium]